MAKRKTKMPKWLFVRKERDTDGSYFFLAEEDQRKAIDGDGPSDVACYLLQKVNRLSKVIKFEK